MDKTTCTRTKNDKHILTLDYNVQCHKREQWSVFCRSNIKISLHFKQVYNALSKSRKLNSSQVRQNYASVTHE